MAAEQPKSDLTMVTELGRYRLCAELASGGMASVHLASTGTDVGFSKLVALKRIHGHLARDPRFIEMFLDEARVASRITHPNVCSVFDFGDVDGTYYIAMEYLVGETFSSITRALRKKDRNAWRAHLSAIVAQAAEGLHAAHELRDEHGDLLGVVHRDVSPQNLFLTYAGCVKVVDFGIARCAGRMQETEPGTIKGKLAYIAPEQVRGDRVDRTADVWSLGVTLWELVTGKPLFRRGTDVETLHAVLSEPIPPPTELTHEVDPELDAIVLKAVSRSPDERWATARDMGRALRDYVRAAGAIVGQVELEEWMLALFPDQQERRQALLHRAREASAVLHRAREASAVRLRNDIQPARLTAGTSAPPRTRRSPISPAFWAGIAVAGSLAIGAAGWVVALARRGPEPEAVQPASVATPEPSPSRGAPAPPALVGPSSDAPPPVAIAPPPSVPSAPIEDGPRPEARARQRTRAPRPATQVAAREHASGAESPREESSAATDAAPEPPVAVAPPAPEPPPAPQPPPAPLPPTPVASPTPATPEPAAVRTAAPLPAPATIVVSPALAARSSIDALQIGGSMPASVIRRAIDRLGAEHQRCYREAASRARRDAPGEVRVSFTIDEMGAARRVSATGGPLPGVAACVRAATDNVRTAVRPDTGSVSVSYSVRFVPLPPRR